MASGSSSSPAPAAAAAWAASSPGALDLLLLVTGSLALAGHRRAPRAVLAVTTLCLFGYVVLAQPGSSGLVEPRPRTDGGRAPGQ
ncbi:hypothetical protein [Streptomyces sp. D54]|uniref:hypothetical protein n=1 Tax=Streptomyces sp. D54 TaxID=1290289 RepID=UPI003CF4499C